jgi:hypothetical protein
MFRAERGGKRTSGMGRLERMKHSINMHLPSPVKAFFPEIAGLFVLYRRIKKGESQGKNVTLELL